MMAAATDTYEEYDEEPLGDPPPERPVPALPRPAQPAARRNLADALEKRGFSRPAAEAIARVPVDPSELRRSLDFPTHITVPSGTLAICTTRGWTPAIASNLGNPRLESDRVYPFAVPRGGGYRTQYPPLHDPVATPNRNHELVLTVMDRGHAEWGMDLSRAFLKNHNDYEDDIAAQGISLPITVAACVIEHEDGSPPVAVAVAEDGSSRVDSAHRVLNVSGRDILYDFTKPDERSYRRIIGTLYNKQAQGVPLEGPQARQARALTSPVAIVVGFEAMDGGHADFASALAEYVAMFHLAPPKPWGDAAERGTKADAALTQLVRDKLLDEVFRDYLAGMLSAEEARGAGFASAADIHAAHVIRALAHPDHHTSIRDGLRRLAVGTKRFQARRRIKGEVAAELVLRAAQGRLPNDVIAAIRPTLARTLEMSHFHSDAWRVTGRRPDALRDAALAELAKGRQYGPAAIELAARAALALAEGKVLRREAGGGTQLDQSDFRDRRGPAAVLEQLLPTQQGIHLLHRALIDGSARRSILAVDANGAPIPDEAGADVVATDLWVRRTWKPEGWTADLPPRTPGDRFVVVVADLFTTVHALARRLETVESVADSSGQRLVDQFGLPSTDARAAVQQLRHVEDALTRYSVVADMRAPSVSEQRADQE